MASPATPWWVKVLPLLAVVYVLSPVDVIPDVAPVLGWLDDVGVLALVTGIVLRAFRRHMLARNGVGVDPVGAVETVGSDV